MLYRNMYNYKMPIFSTVSVFNLKNASSIRRHIHVTSKGVFPAKSRLSNEKIIHSCTHYQVMSTQLHTAVATFKSVM